ncbi:hypothetical protein LOK49_LG01G01656 [Camellia lanceoleosa]|uniref:Uncharacterized protein n=1 Tax=Camellia lanceoleosa TaxID=1840588 RepID=A0ACC0IY01_9ERIC|nr:hypothetical protein LOK49_LG01G01656 [Camellia lanceoleosa]
MITAISSKMNIPVPVFPHVAPSSPSPPPPIPPLPPPRLEIGGGGGGGGEGEPGVTWGKTGTGIFILVDMAVTISFRVFILVVLHLAKSNSSFISAVCFFASSAVIPLQSSTIASGMGLSRTEYKFPPPLRSVPVLSDKMTMLFYGENDVSEKHKRRKECEVFEANIKEKGAVDLLLRGGGNWYSVWDKPMPEAIAELWRVLTGLDVKK